MHSMQAGYLEKAQKYTDKALMQLEKLKSESRLLFLNLKKRSLCMFFKCLSLSLSSRVSVGLQPHPLNLSSHSTGAHHHVSARHGPQGHRAARGTSVAVPLQRDEDPIREESECSTEPNVLVLLCRVQISQVCQLCQQSPRLFTNHAAQLHTLLVSIGQHFNVCMRVPLGHCCKARKKTKRFNQILVKNYFIMTTKNKSRRFQWSTENIYIFLKVTVF